MKNILSTTIIGCLLIGCTETTPLSSTDQQENIATANYPTETINCFTPSYEKDGKEITKSQFYYLESINKTLLESPDEYSSLGLTTITNCDEAKQYIEFKNNTINSTPYKSDLSYAPIEEKEDKETEQLALKVKASLISGTSETITEEQGVISIANEYNLSLTCMGVMINRTYALTSANCIQNKSQTNYKTFNTRNVVIKYFDPYDGSSSPRIVKPATSNILVKVIPTYHGSGDHQDNLALVYNPAGWASTSNRDYKRIHQDATWKTHYNTLYGNGRKHFYKEVMYKAGIDWNWSSKYYAQAITQHYSKTCDGDEGSPYIANPVYGSYDMVTGIHSGEKRNSGLCGASYESIYITTLSSRTGWLEQEMGFTCNRYSQLSTDGGTRNSYKRCW